MALSQPITNTPFHLAGGTAARSPLDVIGFPTESKADAKAEVAGTTETALSGVTSFAIQCRLSELTCSSTETGFTYRRDNSLAVRVSSVADLSMKTEQVKIDVTFTAESLGLSAKDCIQPLKIKLTYSQSQLSGSYRVSARTVKPLRSPEEIFQDLAEGICKAMIKSNNPSLRYELDAEAVQSLLQGDPEIAKAFQQILMILNTINLLKRQSGIGEQVVIGLSGKGNPYVDIQEKTHLEMVETTVEINLTILPPDAAEHKISQ